MKKPLHWRKEGDENKAILSAMGLLHPFETLCMLEQKCSMDDIQSALWGIWVEKSIILRPHVYSQFKLGKQIYERIIQRV